MSDREFPKRCYVTERGPLLFAHERLELHADNNTSVRAAEYRRVRQGTVWRDGTFTADPKPSPRKKARKKRTP